MDTVSQGCARRESDCHRDSKTKPAWTPGARGDPLQDETVRRLLGNVSAVVAHAIPHSREQEGTRVGALTERVGGAWCLSELDVVVARGHPKGGPFERP